MDIESELFRTGLAGRPLGGPKGVNPAAGPMSVSHQKFLVPVFSYLDTRQGGWKERRRAWLRMGIQSELGRKDKLTYSVPERLSDGRKGKKVASDTSVFDPFLTELCYRWWCPQGGVVLDPFAGGSVRGIVASKLGRKYFGIELRPEQVEANQQQAEQGLCGKWRPKWVCGDSREALASAPAADFLFSCPPYGNLERYSDLPGDISALSWDDFVAAYTEIIVAACAKLRPGRFACFVVGNFRDQEIWGGMRFLTGATVQAFASAGLILWQDPVLLNNAGSAPIRQNLNFKKGKRKLVTLHQYVLLFLKGKPDQVPDDRFEAFDVDAQGIATLQGV